MRENPIYTVTPPDMLLPDNGPIISVISNKKQFLRDVELLYENMFKSVPITLCHPGGDVNDKNSAWVVSMMRFSDTIYIDLDSISELGIVCALMHNDNNIIIISNNGNKRKGMKQLLNTSREYNIYESVEDYAEIVLDSLETV
ncbi:MAG: hypothetical protein CMQ75_05170 [Gammaproteobacteria bacterium]|nr:hypothetical protein [Gammaproteobacteria bacterium]|tara:strand:- start:6390 stop:6818 length:429 start_codon:yes stop_codon:yes gene_type:complete